MYEKKIKKILDNIEELRSLMEDLVIDKGTIDAEVISISQNLDAELNKYYKMLINKKEHSKKEC